MDPRNWLPPARDHAAAVLPIGPAVLAADAIVPPQHENAAAVPQGGPAVLVAEAVFQPQHENPAADPQGGPGVLVAEAIIPQHENAAGLAQGEEVANLEPRAPVSVNLKIFVLKIFIFYFQIWKM